MENGPFQAKGGSSLNRIFRLPLLPEGILPCYIQVDLIDTTYHDESGIKLRSLRAIGLPADLFQGYTPKLVERLRRRIAAESPSHIRQHPQAIRLTLLAALVVQRTQEVTDALVTLLIQIVHRIGKRAEKRVETAYTNDLK